jgi:hypothetical protein
MREVKNDSHRCYFLPGGPVKPRGPIIPGGPKRRTKFLIKLTFTNYLSIPVVLANPGDLEQQMIDFATFLKLIPTLNESNSFHLTSTLQFRKTSTCIFRNRYCLRTNEHQKKAKK